MPPQFWILGFASLAKPAQNSKLWRQWMLNFTYHPNWKRIFSQHSIKYICHIFYLLTMEFSRASLTEYWPKTGFNFTSKVWSVLNFFYSYKYVFFMNKIGKAADYFIQTIAGHRDKNIETKIQLCFRRVKPDTSSREF